MSDLTDRQKKVLAFVVDYTNTNGYPPTLAEIGKHCRFTKGAAKKHLVAIAAKGFIERDEGTARGIRVVHQSVPLSTT